MQSVYGEDQQEQKRCSKRAKTADVDHAAAKVEKDSCHVWRGEILWNRGRGLFANIMSAEFGTSLEISYKYSLKGENQEGKAVTVLLYKNSAELWEASFAGGEDVDGFGRGLTIAEMDEEDMFEERAEVLVDVVRCEADARGIRLADTSTSSTGASAGTPNHRTAAAAAAGTVPTAAPTPGAAVAAPAAVTPDGSIQVQNAANRLVAAFSDQQTELTNTKMELGETKTELTNTKTKLEETKTEVEETKTELEKTKTELTNTKTKLEETKTELEESKDDLAKTKTALRDALAQRYAPHGTEDAQVQNRVLEEERDMLAEENEKLKIRIQNIGNMANMINGDI